MKSRRDFIKKGIMLSAAAAGAGAMGSRLWAAEHGAESNPFVLPPLPYPADALEPTIDATTMQLHHDKHHAAYVNNLNKALSELKSDKNYSTLESIFDDISSLPDGIRNNAGGHWNHSFFWKVMKPGAGGPPSGDVVRMIDAAFGTFENMKTAFNEAAMQRFGSGWAWLVAHKGTLKVTSTPNQDNPLMAGHTVKGTPVLGLDVWEHAYYLKYQNRRAEYVNAWWNVVNWEEVNNRLRAM